MKTESNWLLYDGECPFCSAYVSLLRLREAVGPLTLADARRHPELVVEVNRLGYTVDEGMVLKLDGRYHHGADCLNTLALLSTPSTAFNQVTRWLFRSPKASRLAYPLLRGGRNVVLRVLGRQRLGA